MHACFYLSHHDRIVQNHCERTINCVGSFGKSLSAFSEGLLHTLSSQFLPVALYSLCRILLLVPQLFSQIWTTTSIKFINQNLNKKALMEKCQFNVFSQISRLTEIILERDANEHYKYFRVPSKDNPTRPTLLHLAAEQNFLHVTKSLVDQYPGLMYLWTKEQDDMPSYLPVELALKKYKDDTAAFLVSRMRHDR